MIPPDRLITKDDLREPPFSEVLAEQVQEPVLRRRESNGVVRQFFPREDRVFRKIEGVDMDREISPGDERCEV